MKRRKIFFSLLLLPFLAITTLTISETGFAQQNNSEPSANIVTATPIANLNVRSGPSLDYETTGIAFNGFTVTLEARSADNSWGLFDDGSQRGWVAVWLCELEGDFSSLPVSDEVVEGGSTHPSTPTPVPTSTPPPEPEPTDSDESEPTAIPNQDELPGYTGHFSNIGPHLRSIYLRGRSHGLNPNSFTKVGDSETAAYEFLYDIDEGVYLLGQYGYLQGVVDRFTGSFGHFGYAVHDGFPAEAMLDPVWADPDECPGEGVLQCEYRVHKPMVALILARTMQQHVSLGSMYHDALRDIVEYSLQRGVIPVLSTSPYWGPIHPSTDEMNATIRAVANEYNVPLWDLYLTTETLPDRGIDPDNTYHTTKPDDGKVAYFIYEDDHMDAGMTRRNLEALEILHAIIDAVE